jgi:transcriptional regulator with XRE-family HTH domain
LENILEGGCMNDDSELANRFRSIRRKTGLSQKDFAQSIGLSQTVIAEIERGGREPSRSVLVAIAQKYKISLDWLLLGIDVNKPVESNDDLQSEIERLKKENAELAEEIRKIEAECQKLDIKNRAISEELLERMRQLVETQNRQLGLA